ncbi:MAG TPA: pyrroloquinoline quinone-dependent dehydrogenase [Rhizomicrobium sp.]|nr:pyrroloquinoline quinone-dependent dehydrogenase [Rhizomicrobium sp.]
MRMGEWVKGLVVAGALILAGTAAHAAAGWGAYGGDQGGTRFSPASQITPANVTSLKEAWSFSTGELTRHRHAIHRSAFENTPILADGKLFVCSPFNAVSAVDPGTGKPIWRYDPKLQIAHMYYPNSFNCRGVAFWHDPKPGALCADRIFLNTNDLRLIALDAKTGKPCADFGNHGTVAVSVSQKRGAPPAAYTTLAGDAEAHRLKLIPAERKVPSWMKLVVLHAKDGQVVGWYRLGGAQITSAPVVTDGTVIVGSSIDDNQRVDELQGAIHAYDAETGQPKWNFDVLSGSPNVRAGAANAWAPMSIDEKRGLLFAPTSSPSPDFWGGDRPGDDTYADSVVALRIADGSVAWSFQVTHHDVWDYDVAAQPTLGTVTYHGRTVDAVIQPTKQGLVFTLDRDTGKPIIPVVERKVPQDGAPGEKLSPTEPIPVAPRPLARDTIKPGDAFGLTFWDRGKCRDAIAKAKYEGMYTPPSTQGTIIFPFTGGGTNWGGLAFDSKTDIAYVNTSNAMHLITLIPAKEVSRAQDAEPNKEISRQMGAPYGMRRVTMLSPIGMPCNPPPWGQLHAIDMHTGKVLWDVPLGTTADMVPFSEYLLGKTGTPNVGGPMVTDGGLVFIGAAMDNYLRAFDAKTGKELWRGRLPAGGQATPMTYMWRGRQYVVIAAGGHEKLGTKRGDQVIAFALPQ